MKMRSFLVMLVLLLAVVSLVPAESAQTHFAIYKVWPSNLDALAAVARAIVTGGDGKVIVDAANNRLLVRATKEQQAQIAALAKELNVPPKNVRIEVRMQGAGTQAESGFGARASGGVVVSTRGTGGHLTIKPTVRHQKTTQSSDVRQTLLVASGREAVLNVGERVPYLDYFVQYGRRHGYFQGQVSWQEVGARLIVKPTVIGDGPLISVTLIPELSGRVGGDPRRIRFAEAATQLTASDGQPISIGGLGSSSEFNNRFLVGFNKAGGVRSLTITLTAHIMPTLSPPRR